MNLAILRHLICPIGKFNPFSILSYMNYPNHLSQLIESLKRLPGVGNKSAERFAFHMLDWKEEQLNQAAELISQIPHRLKRCEECGCLKGEDACNLCHPSRYDQGILCLTASPKDVFAIEETHQFKGIYHVLGSLISPLEGRGPESLPLAKIKRRIAKHEIREVVIALDSTLEGDATSLFLKKELSDLPVVTSRLALGLPMGSSLDYVDGGTLARAFLGRASF
jgi:recombination protein RecR